MCLLPVFISTVGHLLSPAVVSLPLVSEALVWNPRY